MFVSWNTFEWCLKDRFTDVLCGYCLILAMWQAQQNIYIYVRIVKWIGMQMIQFRLQTVSIDELDD